MENLILYSHANFGEKLTFGYEYIPKNVKILLFYMKHLNNKKNQF